MPVIKYCSAAETEFNTHPTLTETEANTSNLRTTLQRVEVHLNLFMYF